MSKITIQYQLANISTSTIMTLTITEIIIEQLRNIRATSTETLKERLKQRENFWIIKLETFSVTWSEPSPKLNPFHADFAFSSIIF